MVLLWVGVTWNSEVYPVSVPLIMLSWVILLMSDILIPPELFLKKYRSLLLEWNDREPVLFFVGCVLLLLSDFVGWLSVATFVVEAWKYVS